MMGPVILQRLDDQSRWHVRTFTSQVVFLSLIALPVLLIDQHAPTLYLQQLQKMFGIAALVLLALGVVLRQALSRSSLCVWDHFLAFVLLKAGCSIAVEMLQ